MEIVYSTCVDEEILYEQELLNKMYIRKDIYSSEERLLQSQKLDKLMNEKQGTFVAKVI